MPGVLCKLFFFKARFCYTLVQTPKLENNPLTVDRTHYSANSQLLYISESRPFHPQPEKAPCRGGKGPHTYISKRRKNIARQV